MTVSSKWKTALRWPSPLCSRDRRYTQLRQAEVRLVEILGHAALALHALFECDAREFSVEVIDPVVIRKNEIRALAVTLCLVAEHRALVHALVTRAWMLSSPLRTTIVLYIPAILLPVMVTSTLFGTQSDTQVYDSGIIRAQRDDFGLKDPSLIDQWMEYPDQITNAIMSIVPGFVLHQIMNSLGVRQVVPLGVDGCELIWTVLGFEEDTPEQTMIRRKQSNLVGPAGYVSMEDASTTTR
jgi:hypothetical protein